MNKNLRNISYNHRSRVPHGDGLLVYFTDDKYGRYNYSGKFEEGEIASLGEGTTFYRNGNIYKNCYVHLCRFLLYDGAIL